MRDVLNTR